MLSATRPNPWYREPWPWILMAGPATVIVAGAITIWLAVVSFDGLVVDDYYKRGLAINQTIARSDRAHTLGLSGDFSVDPGTGAVDVRVEGGGGATTPATLRLALVFATRAGHDQSLTLTRTSAGRYAGRAGALGPGRWQLLVEDAEGTWRLKGTLNAPREHAASLAP